MISHLLLLPRLPKPLPAALKAPRQLLVRLLYQAALGAKIELEYTDHAGCRRDNTERQK
jgi:hypothetical protein